MLEIEHLSNAELQDTIQEQLLNYKNIESLCKLTRLQDEVKQPGYLFLYTVN